MFGPSQNEADWVRWRRPVGAVVLVLVAAIATRTEPRPALHGVGLVVLLAVAGLLLGGAGLLLGSPRNPLPKPVEALLFAVVIVVSVTLVWIEPNGAGFFGGFVVATAAANRMRGWIGATITGALLAALALAAFLGTHREPLPVLLSALGVIAFYRLGLYARKLRSRTEESERLLAELEQTREAQVQAAALAERQRLAREMHDVLAHSLSGLLLHLEGARLLAVHSGADPRLTDTIERAHHLAQTGLGEARQAIGTLRGDDLPGPERLPALAEEFERDSGVHCGLTVSGTPAELGAQTRLTLYRVAQEALTNIRKHARPDRVELVLEYETEGTRLTVEDIADTPRRGVQDGQGYGVSGMRERAELLGGELTAAPTETGFRVTLWAPA